MANPLANCKFDHIDCSRLGANCDLCFDSFHYRKKVAKQPSQRKQSVDKRMGSSFEFKNHQNNAALLGVSTNMTPNSGATGRKKGDEQISGIIEIMEELKTKISKQAPGKETFTMKKEWLEKLNKEAQRENKEFWYLKFSFHEHDENVYVVTEQDIIMSMVKTMVIDRQKANKADALVDVAEKQRQKIHADLIAAQAEIELLKSQLRLTQLKKENPV